MKKLIIALSILSAQVQAQVLNPAVTRENIKSTICTPGYSTKVRPASSKTNAIKKQMLKDAKIPLTNIKDYELDHVINISIGGALLDKGNLQLQPWPQALKKDVAETRMWRYVCSGKIPLSVAQQCMYKDWTTCPTK